MPSDQRVLPEAAQLERVASLLEADRVLDALAAARETGPLAHWAWGEPATLAARLLSWTGGQRESTCLHLLNWRHRPDDDQALLFALFHHRAGRGPLWALRTIRQRLDGPPAATPAVQAELLAFHATMLASYRDFASAHAAIDTALTLAPEAPWIWTEYADVHARQDAWEASLAAIEHALELRPGYRPAVLAKANALVSCQRESEAIRLCEAAHERSQNGHYALQVSAIWSARDDAEQSAQIGRASCRERV